MYVGLKHEPRGDGERYVTPARAAAKETSITIVKVLNMTVIVCHLGGTFSVVFPYLFRLVVIKDYESAFDAVTLIQIP